MSQSSKLILQEFQFTYDILEDRLFMQLQSEDQQRHSLWFTRRLMARVLPGLRELLQRHGSEQHNSIDYVGEQRLSENHIEKKFQHRDSEPPRLIILGEWQLNGDLSNINAQQRQSLLISRVEVSGESQALNLVRIDLQNEQRQGVRMIMSLELLQILCDMMSKAIDTAQWNLHVLQDGNVFDTPMNEDEPFVDIKSSGRPN